MQIAWAQNCWVSSHDDTQDPGWMLPCIVLCRVYTAYLNTTPDAHMHRMQRPLPLGQLYDPDAPAAGLLALLKFALWQVLWVESPTSKSPCSNVLSVLLLVWQQWHAAVKSRYPCSTEVIEQ